MNGVRLAACNLKGPADAIGKQLGSDVVALVSTAEGKASIVVGVSAGHGIVARTEAMRRSPWRWAPTARLLLFAIARTAERDPSLVSPTMSGPAIPDARKMFARSCTRVNSSARDQLHECDRSHHRAISRRIICRHQSLGSGQEPDDSPVFRSNVRADAAPALPSGAGAGKCYLDTTVLRAAMRSVVRGDRLRLAEPLRRDKVRLHALRDHVRGPHRIFPCANRTW